MASFWAFWVLLGALCMWEVLAFLVLHLSCVQDSGYGGVPIAGHAHRAEVGGGIIFATLGEFAGMHKKLPVISRRREMVPCEKCRFC